MCGIPFLVCPRNPSIDEYDDMMVTEPAEPVRRDWGFLRRPTPVARASPYDRARRSGGGGGGQGVLICCLRQSFDL